MLKTLSGSKNWTSLMLAMVLSLSACSTDETVTTAGENFSGAAVSDLQIRAVSTRPWLVTGGDVLLEVSTRQSATAAQPVVNVNGNDISNQLVQLDSLRWQLLLTDLPGGDSEVQASLGEQRANLLLSNYPISGPIISGPHEAPFYCQTNEFEMANGEVFGPPEDSNCFRSTQVNYVYWSDEDESFKPYTLAFGSLPPTDIAARKSLPLVNPDPIITTIVPAGVRQRNRFVRNDFLCRSALRAISLYRHQPAIHLPEQVAQVWLVFRVEIGRAHV